MKQIFTFLIVLISFQNFFSQTYQFDYLIKYVMANHKNGYSKSNDQFVNSTNRSYDGSFSPTIDNKGYNLIVYDYNNNLLHTFRIDKADSPSDGSKYVYINSGYMLANAKLEKEQKAQVYTHTFVEDIPGGKRMMLRKFKDAKDKKADVEMTADFIAIDADLRPFSYVSLFSTRADFVTLNDGENYFLRDAKWKVKDSEGEYHTNIYKIPLILTLDPKNIKLPKEKPKSMEEQIEEWKKTIIDRRGF